ncbi:hypothetical protein OUZ56_000295 [Daphnia magna]|uniref:Uncharacterized protein n=1 Tax=Daphnia magna TaxID=35525 RepID=A0ABQ9ZZ95_9CRUS|nr:hypothetical protein OUZ56_000295 [Daphnia magna]
MYIKDEKVIHNQQAELVRSSLFLDTEVGIVPDELNGLACCFIRLHTTSHCVDDVTATHTR